VSTRISGVAVGPVGGVGVGAVAIGVGVLVATLR